MAFHCGVTIIQGDELMSAVKIPPSNWSAVATKAKSLMAAHGGGLVYGNLGGDPRPLAVLGRLPAAVDLISADLYTCRDCAYPPTDSEATVAKAFYDQNFFPRMERSQKVLVVPGLFADPNVSRSGSLTSQDLAVEKKLQGYVDWIKAEERIVGINCWHWSDDKDTSGKWLAAFTDKAVGAASLPRTVKLMEQLATKRPEILRSQREAVSETGRQGRILH